MITAASNRNDDANKGGLFRPEVIETVECAQLGSVLLTHPFSHYILTSFSLVFTIALGLFFFTFETSRKTHATGVIVPSTGLIKLVPMQAGTIVETRIKEGEKVIAGQVLFVLSGERSSSNASSAQLTISNLIQQRRNSFDDEIKQSRIQTRLRADVLRSRVKGLEADIARVKGQITLQQARISLVEESLRRYRELSATNYISAAQVQEKQAELIDQQQRMADLSGVQSATFRELLGANAELREVFVQSERDEAALRRNVAAIEQDLTENEARREILVRAPQNGTIGTIATDVGQSVSGGTVLASMIPAGADLEVELYAPSRAIGFVKLGMPVLLRYQAYPYQKFGQYKAKVSEIAHTALSPNELSAPSAVTGTSEPLYRIRLRLDEQSVRVYGRTISLKTGMLVEASVVLERRKIYEWVLEPLFSITGRL